QAFTLLPPSPSSGCRAESDAPGREAERPPICFARGGRDLARILDSTTVTNECRRSLYSGDVCHLKTAATSALRRGADHVVARGNPRRPRQRRTTATARVS